MEGSRVVEVSWVNTVKHFRYFDQKRTVSASNAKISRDLADRTRERIETYKRTSGLVRGYTAGGGVRPVPVALSILDRAPVVATHDISIRPHCLGVSFRAFLPSPTGKRDPLGSKRR
jgi:hypothetical protein